jgi:hypothetical protein
LKHPGGGGGGSGAGCATAIGAAAIAAAAAPTNNGVIFVSFTIMAADYHRRMAPKRQA